jgi:hypothetical protein
MAKERCDNCHFGVPTTIERSVYVRSLISLLLLEGGERYDHTEHDPYINCHLEPVVPNQVM